MAEGGWTLHPFLAVEDVAKPRMWYVLCDEDNVKVGVDCPGIEAGSTCVGLSQRLGHSCVRVDDALIFFGGANPHGVMNDVAVYQPLTLSWRDGVACAGKPPSARYDHAGVYLQSQNALCIFGGATETGNLNDVHFLDLSTFVWTQPAVSGEVPCARTMHSAAHTDTQLIVFCGGGCGPTSVSDTAVYVLDARLRTWTAHLSRGDAPTARQAHTMNTIGRRVFVYGGMDGGVFFGDVFVWDLDTHVWTCPDVAGPIPPPRASHSAVSVGTLLYVYGGLGLDGGAPAALVDLWELDTVAMVWAPVPVAGPPVGPRMDFTMCAVHLPSGSAVGSTPHSTEEVRAVPAVGVDTPVQHATPRLQDITVMFGANGVPLDSLEIDTPADLPAVPPVATAVPAATVTTSTPTAATVSPTVTTATPVAVAAAAPPTTADPTQRVCPLPGHMPTGPLALVVFGGVSLEGAPYGDLVAVVP